jgi:hypothetical protein
MPHRPTLGGRGRGCKTQQGVSQARCLCRNTGAGAQSLLLGGPPQLAVGGQRSNSPADRLVEDLQAPSVAAGSSSSSSSQGSGQPTSWRLGVCHARLPSWTAAPLRPHHSPTS